MNLVCISTYTQTHTHSHTQDPCILWCYHQFPFTPFLLHAPLLSFDSSSNVKKFVFPIPSSHMLLISFYHLTSHLASEFNHVSTNKWHMNYAQQFSTSSFDVKLCFVSIAINVVCCFSYVVLVLYLRSAMRCLLLGGCHMAIDICYFLVSVAYNRSCVPTWVKSSRRYIMWFIRTKKLFEQELF